MTDQLEKIPTKAWEGVEDPLPDTYRNCQVCGGSNTKTISIAEMMRRPHWQIINENTFMIPNVMWGYVQCADCEAKRKPPPWFRRALADHIYNATVATAKQPQSELAKWIGLGKAG